MANATTTAALASKDIDAAFGNFPLISLHEVGRARIVYTTKATTPPLSANPPFWSPRPSRRPTLQLVAKIVKAIVAAARWSSDEANRDALMEIWARSGTPASVFRYDFADQPLRYRNTPMIDPVGNP
jgi:sulfonate transport system substrate-binding protein